MKNILAFFALLMISTGAWSQIYGRHTVEARVSKDYISVSPGVEMFSPDKSLAFGFGFNLGTDEGKDLMGVSGNIVVKPRDRVSLFAGVNTNLWNQKNNANFEMGGDVKINDGARIGLSQMTNLEGRTRYVARVKFTPGASRP